MRHSLSLLLFVLTIIPFTLSADSPLDREIVKVELIFISDWGVVELFPGYYDNLENPAGFREGSMKLSFDGSLSHFSVSNYQIHVIKYHQYDSTPVTIEILVDLGPSGAGGNAIIMQSNHGGMGSIEGKVWSLDGTFLGSFNDDLTSNRGYQQWQQHIIQWTPTGLQLQNPESATLSKSYPNPFNPTTTIEFSIEKNSAVKLEIYDSLGRTVRTLLDTPMPEGQHSILWDGYDDNGMALPSGTYFYRLNADEILETKRMTLLK
jgi:hypothetical protein